MKKCLTLTLLSSHNTSCVCLSCLHFKSLIQNRFADEKNEAMKHLYYPCTASLCTVLCIHKLWCVSYILYIWRHFVQYKTIVRKKWLMLQQQSCYFFSDSKHCCTLLFSEALPHAQQSPFSFDFPEVLWPCGKYLQLGLVRICLSHIQQTCVMGEREQGALGRFPQNKSESLIVTTPLLLHIVQHCLRQGCENEYNYQTDDCCAQTSQPMIWLIHH